jgi:hypothetical protein
MSTVEKTTTLPDSHSFESVLDDTFSRLWDRKVRYSLRRIAELDRILERMERELDDIPPREIRT